MAARRLAAGRCLESGKVRAGGGQRFEPVQLCDGEVQPDRGKDRGMAGVDDDAWVERDAAGDGLRGDGVADRQRLRRADGGSRNLPPLRFRLTSTMPAFSSKRSL